MLFYPKCLHMKYCIQRLLMPLLMLALIVTSPDIAAQQADGNIRGQVTDTDGNALPGASVMIKGPCR